ncbi:MAG: acyltransferase family protein [Lachnospiraceae bacterium]|nr:acyltransferase family protein [Lachnospiraceae bacterium]
MDQVIERDNKIETKKASFGRMEFVDVAKGIAMICIVLGHMGISGINRFVFTFHVPVFFLISGYFISAEEKLSSFIVKKLRTLIVPYFLTCGVIVVLGVLKGLLLSGMGGALHEAKYWLYASIYGAGDSYQEPFYIAAIGAIWFLWALFWGSIFLKISLKMKPVLRLAFVIALFLFGYFTRSWFWFPLSIQAGCCATLWVYIGYLFKRFQEMREKLPPECKYIALLFSFVVWVYFIIQFQTFWLVHCDIGRGVVDIFGSLCASYAVIQISRYIWKIPLIGRGLAYLGKYSLFMLCIHIIELDLFPWDRVRMLLENRFSAPSFLSTLVIIVGKLIIIIALTVLASKITFIKRLFGIRVETKKENV